MKLQSFKYFNKVFRYLVVIVKHLAYLFFSDFYVSLVKKRFPNLDRRGALCIEGFIVVGK